MNKQQCLSFKTICKHTLRQMTDFRASWFLEFREDLLKKSASVKALVLSVHEGLNNYTTYNSWFPTFPPHSKRTDNENKKHPTNPKYHKRLLSYLCSCEQSFHLLFSSHNLNAATSDISNRLQNQKKLPLKASQWTGAKLQRLRKGTRKTHQHVKTESPKLGGG